MRILFITSNNVGDAVLNNGLLARLLAQSSRPKVTVVAGRASSGLYQAMPGLAELIVLEKERCHRHWFKLWAQVARERWDLVADMRRTALGLFLRSGKRLVTPPKDMTRHRVVELGALTPDHRPPAPVAWSSPEDNRRAAQWIATGSPVLALGPTANWPGKQWPCARFIALARALSAKNAPLEGAHFAVFATASERAQAAPLLDSFPPEQIIDLVGRTTLGEAAACLKRCDYYIGNDSGLMHLAAACGVPTLGLFGPSCDVRYHPWGEKAWWVRTPETLDDIIQAPGYDRHNGLSYMTTLCLDRVQAIAEEMISDQRRREYVHSSAFGSSGRP